jgi:acetyltransferase-like isoleucine patch superfamily enzyme
MNKHRIDESEEAGTLDAAIDMEALRAAAKSQAIAEFQEIERKALIAQMLEEERAKLRPPEPEPEPEELVSITIDVPPNMFVNQMNETGITINGRAYVHGVTYQVSGHLANDLRHLMFRANHNEKSMGSPNRDLNRRKLILAPAGQVVIDSRVA